MSPDPCPSADLLQLAMHAARCSRTWSLATTPGIFQPFCQDAQLVLCGAVWLWCVILVCMQALAAVAQVRISCCR